MQTPLGVTLDKCIQIGCEQPKPDEKLIGLVAGDEYCYDVSVWHAHLYTNFFIWHFKQIYFYLNIIWMCFFGQNNKQTQYFCINDSK